MCKFNNRLFIYVFIVLLIDSIFIHNQKNVLAQPIYSYYDFLSDDDYYDYDLHYDQRQNGTENFRIKLDGFVIALPAEQEEKETNQSNAEDLLNSLVFGDSLLHAENKETQQNIDNKNNNVKGNGNVDSKPFSYEYEKADDNSHKDVIHQTENDMGGSEKHSSAENLDENIVAQKSADVHIPKSSSSSSTATTKNNMKKRRTKLRLINLLKLLQRKPED